MFNVGDVIRFHDNCIENEWDVSPNIMARIVNIEHPHNDEVVEVRIDVSEFKSHNAKYWEANYYDKDHNPTLKFTETTYYNDRFEIYIEQKDFDSGKYFSKADDIVSVDAIAEYLRDLRCKFLSDDNAIRRYVVEDIQRHFNLK